MSQEVEDDHISFFNGLVYLQRLPFGCFGASQLGQGPGISFRITLLEALFRAGATYP
jgi:hypothetical protein